MTPTPTRHRAVGAPTTRRRGHRRVTALVRPVSVRGTGRRRVTIPAKRTRGDAAADVLVRPQSRPLSARPRSQPWRHRPHLSPAAQARVRQVGQAHPDSLDVAALVTQLDDDRGPLRAVHPVAGRAAGRPLGNRRPWIRRAGHRPGALRADSQTSVDGWMQVALRAAPPSWVGPLVDHLTNGEQTFLLAFARRAPDYSLRGSPFPHEEDPRRQSQRGAARLVVVLSVPVVHDRPPSRTRCDGRYICVVEG